MNRYLVLYRAPVTVLDDWMKTPEEERKAMEADMKSEWDAWMKEHAAHVKETAGAGKAKTASANGITDTRNDIMMFSLVEADSPEAAASMFEGHPHLKIPQATIDIMPANFLPGMA